MNAAETVVNIIVMMMQVLVGGGAEIDLLDAGGDSALHQAAENGHVKAVRVS